MASTWSTNLKIELLGVGDTNWGTLTNNNFQYAFEESITGYATVTFPSDATYDWAALYTNSNSSQAQRNLVLNVVGTLSGTRELIVPTIEKQYIVQNNTTGGQAITVKTSAGTGVTVPNGRKMHVYVNGTNVIQMDDYDVSRTIGTLSLTNALAVAQGGTGTTTSTGTGSVVLSNSPALVTPNLGTPSALTLTNATGLPLATGVTGTLAIANGGTGLTALGTGVATALGQNVTGSGGIVLATSPTLVTPTLGVATATSINKVAITAPASGSTLTIANGKTLTVSRTLTLTGTDSTTMTFPSTNATIARTDAAQTFTGVQTFNSDISVNSIEIGRGSGNDISNTAVGFSALLVNTTGYQNVAVGYASLYENLGGYLNTSLGYRALFKNTSGNNNVAVGHDALVTNTTGYQNVAVGQFALGSNSGTTVEINCTAVGHGALSGAYSPGKTITGNTAIGAATGQGILTGSYNTLVGAGCQPSVNTGNDQIVVGYYLTGKGDDTAFIGGTNGAYNEKNVTTWETTSDARLKKNIVDNNDGLAKIEAIRVRNFEYRTPEEINELPVNSAIKKSGVQLGVIAQEMLPECVSETSEGVLSVNTDPLVWYLVNAVKELSAQVKALQAQLK